MTGDTILETFALEKRFGGVRAIADVDFRLQTGELRCLIGPNGAGKSTFFKMITGQHRPTGGRVMFDGTDITAAPAYRIGRLGIGIKNQVPDVFDGLSTAENLWLAARFARRGPRARETVAAVVERLALAPILDAPVGELAHGQRQWVEIAMVIAREPKLILLDEPSAGMSLDETNRTAALIREVNRTTTMIVVEHDMQFIRQIATKVTVFHQGRILVEDSVDRVMSDPMVRDIYLGKQAAA
ncbi:MAG: ATP-binding cassette domain-containing protein [Alphaproteobacteria bacterium]|jgi:branched-chain amino acid transport system ATP-binding protein/urea transport system ATP-binding protein|nr:ATP-binding cassette domain-containing protein [Alphaproteobacteria bacterium]